jgi:hypothetical protein
MATRWHQEDISGRILEQIERGIIKARVLSIPAIVPDLLASSWGRAMVEPYIGQLPKGGERVYAGKPRIGQWDGGRYVYFHQRSGRTFKVHRLIAETFLGPAAAGASVLPRLNNTAA